MTNKKYSTMQLQLEVSANQPIRMVQISDSHLMADRTRDFLGYNPYQHLHKIIKQLGNTPIDCVLSSGDLAQQSSEKTYHDYFDEIAQLKAPHFWIRGNHDDGDAYPRLIDEEELIAVHMGNWYALLLDSHISGQIKGQITAQQFDLMRDFIEQHPDSHFVIGMHHPCFEVDSPWLDQHKLINAQQFLDFIALFPQIRLVLCGHIHQEFRFRFQHIDVMSCPSTWALFEPQSDTFALAQHPPGYRLITLYPNGDVETTVEYLRDWQPSTQAVPSTGY